MNIITDEISNEIFNRLSIKDQLNLVCSISLRYNPIFNRLFTIKKNSIIKIQRFYKNNLPRLPLENGYNPNYSNLYDKKLLVRHYIAHYPINHLLMFPEFLINKCAYRNDRETLMNWIVEKTPHNISDRKVRHVRDFLMMPQIIKKDIIYAGW